MLHGSRLILRSLSEDDLNDNYLQWLNDPLVNQYLETRFIPQSLQQLKSYWLKHSSDANSPWFAICLSSDCRHIGNIKLGPINWIHRRADISLFIGDKCTWGQGYASEAIKVLVRWAFSELNLYKLNAGIYSSNVGSRKAFEKAGFYHEATLIEDVYSSGKRCDVLRYGLTLTQWTNQS